MALKRTIGSYIMGPTGDRSKWVSWESFNATTNPDGSHTAQTMTRLPGGSIVRHVTQTVNADFMPMDGYLRLFVGAEYPGNLVRRVVGNSVTSLLMAPDGSPIQEDTLPGGEYLGGNKKQILMWIERDAFVPAGEENLVFDTSIARIGLLSCMDGLIPETARTLACQGADIILNSLCSNGLDEAHLHIPARAAENGVYMISANRIGDMVKGADLERLIAGTGMDREKVRGAGESQIVGPHGQVIARASRDLYGLTIADIDLDLVENSDRLRHRRPDLYAVLTDDNAALAGHLAGRAEAGIAEIGTLVPDPGSFQDMLRQSLSLMEECEAGLVVLPELFAWQPTALKAGRSPL